MTKLKPFLRVDHGSRTRLRTLAVAGTAMLSLASFAVVTARPALADPAVFSVAVGAEITQDVMSQFATDVGADELGSYNAVNPVTQNEHDIVTPVKAGPSAPSCSFTRPDGSSEGLGALRQSINRDTNAGLLPDGPQPACVDIDRSVLAPGADQRNDGALVFIPFALDAVTGATGPVGTTAITQADAFTLNDLQTLYAHCGTVTEGGVTYNPMTATAGQVQINLYLPYSVPGTQNPTDTAILWSGLGFNSLIPPTCVHRLIVAGPDAGQQVREDDGTAVATDPNGYMPFSVAQWIGQRNGHDDRRHGAVLHKIDGISPFSNGNPATGTLNTAFAPGSGFVQEVYNVVQYDRVVNTGDGNFDLNLAALLAGTGSALCQDTFTIEGYGFATISTPQDADNCGSTASSLRAFDASDPV